MKATPTVIKRSMKENLSLLINPKPAFQLPIPQQHLPITI